MLMRPRFASLRCSSLLTRTWRSRQLVPSAELAHRFVLELRGLAEMIVPDSPTRIGREERRSKHCVADIAATHHELLSESCELEVGVDRRGRRNHRVPQLLALVLVG